MVNKNSGALSPLFSTVKRTLGMSNATCERLISRMKDENSELYKAMTKAGAKYISEGQGKRAFITKESIQGLN